MNKIYYPALNTKLTFLGGQTLTWEEEFCSDDKVFLGFYSEYIIQIKYDIKKEILYWQTYPQKDRYEIIEKLLRLKYYFTDHANLETDQKIVQINNTISLPIVVLEQEFFSTALAFIISQNNNIKRIKKIINSLRFSFGEKIFIDNKEYYLFPKYENLKKLLHSNEIYKYGLGYRSKYVLDFIEKYKDIDIRNTNELEKQLLSIKGIGPKVCDCILVFSGIKKYATPIDVWTKRGIKHLFQFETNSYNKLRNLLADKFKNVTYIAGQYIFEYARLAKLQ